MLRITRSTKDGTVWLKLEGKLAADWVEECRATCAAETTQGLSPCLDLTEVTYVDRAGAELLCRLAREGLRFPLRSNFVAELLRLEQP
ncbi:MAG: STAS domain-containing protein [Phycisphaerae bacterium]